MEHGWTCACRLVNDVETHDLAIDRLQAMICVHALNSWAENVENDLDGNLEHAYVARRLVNAILSGPWYDA